MPGVEFIRRFFEHVLPRGLRHIRSFGFMGPRVRSEILRQIRELLGVAPRESVPPPERAANRWDGDTGLFEQLGEAARDADQPAPRRCRACGGELVLVAETPRPTVAQLMHMSPSMEPRAEIGQVQLHLALSAFL